MMQIPGIPVAELCDLGQVTSPLPPLLFCKMGLMMKDTIQSYCETLNESISKRSSKRLLGTRKPHISNC